MENEGSYVALGLKTWNTQIDRADKLFGGFSSEEILREIAPGRNRLLYLWGHLTAVHDAMLPLLSLGEFILSLMSPSSRIPTNRDPIFLRTSKFAWHGTSSTLNCGRGLKQCLGPSGSRSTRQYRKKISPKTLRAIASRSY